MKANELPLFPLKLVLFPGGELRLRIFEARYLDMIPRVWEAMERDLAHPALAPVAMWFDANIPRALRDAGGGTIA